MKSKYTKKPILDGLNGSFKLSENTIIRLKLDPLFKDLAAKNWKDLNQLVDSYLNNSITWLSTSQEFYTYLCRQFDILSTKGGSMPVNNYSKSISAFLKTAQINEVLKKIYEKKERTKRFEEAEERLQKENAITTRDLLAQTSKGIASNLRSALSNSSNIASSSSVVTSSSSVIDSSSVAAGSSPIIITTSSADALTSNESSFILDSPKVVNEDVATSESYILSLFEIGVAEDADSVIQIDNFSSIEERLEFSSIEYIEDTSMNKEYHLFTDTFSQVLNKMRRSLSHRTEYEVEYTGLDKKEKNILRYVHSIYDTVKKIQSLSYVAAPQMFNALKNKERDFIAKGIYPLLFGVFNDTSFFIHQEITSNVYNNCQLPIVFCEHDFIIIDSFGVEVGTCEVKPPEASLTEVENDICRIAESTKRQLHKRIMQAKSEKEIITFGIMFNGYKVTFYTHTLESGRYSFNVVATATLPSSPSLFSNMEDFLEKALYFRNLIEASIPSQKESPIIAGQYTSFFKPTLCKLCD